jgi:hypothetical protein
MVTVVASFLACVFFTFRSLHMDKIPNHAVYYWLMGGGNVLYTIAIITNSLALQVTISHQAHEQCCSIIVKCLQTSSQTSDMVAHFHPPTHHLSATTRLRSFVTNQTLVHHRTVPQISAQNVPLIVHWVPNLHQPKIWSLEVLRIPAGSVNMVRCGEMQ